jgi:hypothetical protein
MVNINGVFANKYGKISLEQNPFKELLSKKIILNKNVSNKNFGAKF